MKYGIFNLFVLLLLLALVGSNTCADAQSGLTTTSSSSSINLAWDAPRLNTDGSIANDIAYYKIKTSLRKGNYSKASITVVSSLYTSETISNLLPKKKYYFTVTAVDFAGNESAPSNEATFTSAKSSPYNSEITPANPQPISAPSVNFAPNDFDGDKRSDLLVSFKKKYRAFISNSNSPATGAVYERSTGTTVGIGSGDLNGDGTSSIITVSKGKRSISSSGAISEKKQLMWTETDPTSTLSKSLGQFGDTSDKPIFGCHRYFQFIPAVYTRWRSSVGGQTINFAVNPSVMPKSLFIPGRIRYVACSYEPSGNSRLITITSIKTTSTLRYYSIVDGSIISENVLPFKFSNSYRPYLSNATGTRQTTIGFVRTKRRAATLYNADGTERSTFPLPLNIKRIASTDSGNSKDEFSWVALIGSKGDTSFIRLGSSSVADSMISEQLQVGR